MPLPSPTQTPARTPDLRQTTLQNNLPGSNGAITDPNALDPNITANNTLRGQRLGFGVQAQQTQAQPQVGNIAANDTVGGIQAAFNAQLPGLNEGFRQESENLAKTTSALGRTGSGLFNKETGFIGDRARQAREALLGNLAFQATQADAGRALQAEQANLQSGLTQQNLAAQIAEANAGRTQNVDFARQDHLGGLQTREDQLASDALRNRQTQLNFLQQGGFQGSPTGAIGNAAQVGLQAGQEFGANAGQLGAQAGGLTQEAIQAFMAQMNNRQQPVQPVAG